LPSSLTNCSAPISHVLSDQACQTGVQ
jgi:hypothetical protein